MKLKDSFLLLITILLPSFLMAQVYTVKNYGQKEGLNLTSFLTVEESEDGYLWFGTDGAGLMRYDGADFDYLTDIQGRSNRHVGQIIFDKNKILFTTLYNGAFEFKDSDIEYFSFDSANERKEKAIYKFENEFVVLRDNGISLYRDTNTLLDMKPFISSSNGLHIYSTFKDNSILFIFTSRGNFVISNNRVQALSDWLLTDESVVKDMVVAFRTDEGIQLVDKHLNNELTILMDGRRPSFFVIQEIQSTPLDEDEFIIRSTNKNGELYLLSSKGGIISKDKLGNKYTFLGDDIKNKINNPTDILMDYNGDLWITTYTNGVYRVSIEPFTKIGKGEMYQKPNTTFIGLIGHDSMILSLLRDGTYIGEKFENLTKVSNRLATSITKLSGKYLVAMSNGIYEIQGNQLRLYQPVAYLENEHVSIIGNMYGYLWYGILNQGLFRKDLDTGKEIAIPSEANNFLTYQVSSDSSSVYYGTNNGVYQYSRESGFLSKIPSKVDSVDLGYYVGNSTIDSYGNIWFSFDSGLMGILKSGKVVRISEEQYLPSLLIYTLNADSYGNLYVGSNRGITVIKLNKEGNPLSSNTYDKNNGFYGYETNMRASVQEKDGSILVGTVEGLFKIKPWHLMKSKKPRKPIIYSVMDRNIPVSIEKNKKVIINSAENNILISYKTVNSKSSFVQYSYRIRGESDEWSPWLREESVIINNLESGDHVFEVRASVGGKAISEVSSLAIKIMVPFYKNKWFIISIISLIVILYVFLVDRSQTFDKRNIILSRDVGASNTMGRGMLLFGCIANTAIHILSSRIESTISNHDTSAIVAGLVVFSFYLYLKITRKTGRIAYLYLGLGFLILLGYNTLYTYLSGIHPFYLINMLLIVFLTSYAFKRLRSAIFLSFALLAISVLTMFYVDNAQYNQYLFLITVSLASFLMYLRNNSLEQLIFTSGVINNGSALVVAFDLEGNISYSSENIEILLGIKGELKGRPISFLNEFYPSQEKTDDPSMENVDLASSFKEGRIFVSPLITAENKLVYYQWSCKEFARNVRVILGQDVTDKINLENYYELIVKNAEDVIFQTDTEGVFTFVNDKGQEVLERSKEELIGTSIFDIVSEISSSGVRSFFEETLRTRSKDGYLEFQIHTAKSKYKWMGLKLTTMESPGIDDQVLGFLGLARDVTEALKYKRIIEDQNKDITDSINYARRIQFNMLPKLSVFKDIFEDFFILYRPRDIVSGDFFWLRKVNNKTILIVSDCTGHGVPGSFLTSMGINLLNQIVLEGGVTNPGDILNMLDARLIDLLPRDGRNRITDGMETVVCVFNDDSDLLEYATAGGRFIIVNNVNETVRVIKGQAKHIGDDVSEQDYSYSTEMISVTEDQTVYLFSDGYPDQFGGSKDKKLTFKKFLKLIESIANQELREQNLILQEHLSAWIGEGDQTDDITVIGVRGIRK